MSEILGTRRKRGITAAGLRNWGIVFLLIGLAGRGILQNGLLNLSSVSGAQLFEAMQADDSVMIYATVALIFQCIETCAAPLFAFGLVEGFLHTSSLEKYMTRVALVGLVSEIPYNFAMTGKLLDFGTRNPALSLIICMVMLYFFQKYPEKGLKTFGMKAMAFIGAYLWCQLLRIDQGNCMVILTAVLWAVRKNERNRAVLGFLGSVICSIFDMFYIVSTMSFMLIHMYNGDAGERNRKFYYAVYPVALVVIGIVAKFIV